MRIAIFGLGYVGSVTAACLAKMGHTVVGVDIAPRKVERVNTGHSPVAEQELESLVGCAVRQKRLRATLDGVEALAGAQLSLIAVGTPSLGDGSADLSAVKAAARQIGKGLRQARSFHTVAVRSTVPPGTTARVLIPILERTSGKKVGRDFGVCFHPEFLREGSSVQDFFHPPKTVIGAGDKRSVKVLARLWRPVRAPLWVTSLQSAETLKYAENAFHALKVCFANEIGSLAKSCGANGRQVMDILARDTKLNLSPLYLKPGMPFGGPCLGKDVRALCAVARRNRVTLPLAGAILKSNSRHLRRAVKLVLATGKKRVGVLGLAFKAGTDDVRESPVIGLIRELLRARCAVRVFDPRIHMERLVGANRAYLERQLPAFPRLLARSWKELLKTCDVVVLASNAAEFMASAPRLKRKVVVDLVGLLPSQASSTGRCLNLAG